MKLSEISIVFGDRIKNFTEQLKEKMEEIGIGKSIYEVYVVEDVQIKELLETDLTPEERLFLEKQLEKMEETDFGCVDLIEIC